MNSLRDTFVGLTQSILQIENVGMALMMLSVIYLFVGVLLKYFVIQLKLSYQM